MFCREFFLIKTINQKLNNKVITIDKIPTIPVIKAIKSDIIKNIAGNNLFW